MIAAGDEIAGSGGILADAEDYGEPYESEESILFKVIDLAKILFDGEADPEPGVEVGPVDCPECDFDWDLEWINWDWCEECEEAPAAPAAPLGELILPTLLGCPAEMEAAAGELGLTPEMLQVAMAGALAQNPSIQPCQACRTLVDSAAILADPEAVRVAAMVQIFNTIAPPEVPFTPEMAASLATAFAAGMADPEAPQYATAAEYIDAFVAYVTVLETELGAPVGDSTAFAMAKYGAPLAETGNANIASYIEARLAGI